MRDFTLALIKKLSGSTKPLLVQATREFTSAAIFGGDVMTSSCVGRSAGLNQSLVRYYDENRYQMSVFYVVGSGNMT